MAYEYELLPPIVPDVIPAFGSAQSTVKFYFSIGNYEKLINEHINTIQVSIQQQSQSQEDENGNIQYTFFDVQNIFIDTAESSIIPRAGIETINTNLGDHFIEITNNDTIFPINKLFRIQIRFSRKNFSTTAQIQSKDFSDWSKVCLIKKIEQPELNLLQPFKDWETKSTLNEISFIPYRIVGQLRQSQGENLKTVNISIINIESNEIFLQSGDFIPNTEKSFIYILNKQILQGVKYRLEICFTTQSGYTKTITRKFQSVSQGNGNNLLQININPIPNQGKMQINLTYNGTKRYFGNFIIRRSSMKSQFKDWEDIQVIQFDSELNPYIWEDKTIESGVYYKYGVAPLKKIGWRGQFKQSQIEACFFDDIYLTGDNKQLRIKFDPAISNFKYNLNERVQTPLGSKYPYIRRNGKNFYRSFTLGGLITTYMDTDTNNLLYSDSLEREESNLDENNDTSFQKSVFKNFASFTKEEKKLNNEIKDFTSKNELYNKGYSNNEDPNLPSNKINKYNSEHDIDQYEDIIYEREFRQAVMDFLYKNSVKLFRSNTEGNMLIKLLNITLTPKDNLGRLLYSFSAEAVEIDECNIQNYDKYNIQQINSYKSITNQSTITGQIMESINVDSKKIDLLSLIIQKYKKTKKYGAYIPDFKNIEDWKKLISNEHQIIQGLNQLSALAVKYLKVEIYSLPGLIDINSNSYIENPTEKSTKTCILGHLFQIKYKNEEEVTSNILVKSYFQQKKNKYSNTKFEEASRENNKQFYMGTYIFKNLENIKEILIVPPPKNNNIILNLQYTLDLNNQILDLIPIKSNICLHPAQIKKVFMPNIDIIQSIRNKYLRSYFNNNKVFQNKKQIEEMLPSFIFKRIDKIYRLSLQTPIDAAVEIQTNNNNDNSNNNIHILNTGYLNISMNQSSYISKCTFKGLHFSPCYAERERNNNNYQYGYQPDEVKDLHKYPRKNEFISIKNPDNQQGYFDINPENIPENYLIQNGVYSIVSSRKIQGQIQNNALVTTSDFIYNNNTAIIQEDNNILKYIYINNNWYLFNSDLNIAECPVEAVVNYVYEGGKTEYQLCQS